MKVLAFTADLVAVIEPADEVGQGAAGMGQAHLEVGHLVEHAAENQIRRRDRGIEGIAEQIGQVERTEPFMPADHRQRVQEQGQAVLGNPPEDR